MPERNTSATDFDLPADMDLDRFLVHNRLEIVRILRNLALRNTLVSASFNAGRESLITTVLQVMPEENQVLLDTNINQELNQRLEQADKIVFTSSMDHIKTRFVAKTILRTTHEDRPAFSIPLPDEVFQLQRRESFRIALPITHPVNCRIPAEDGSLYQLPIGDISMGGLSLIATQAEVDIQLEPGCVFQGCHIELPGADSVEVTLRVQNIMEITLKNGKKALHYGCQFIDISRAMESIIQRFLFRLERDSITGGRR